MQPETPINNLKGFTLLRFAHAFGRGGGIEQLLEELDSELLQRNEMTILRLTLSPPGSQSSSQQMESVGSGRLIRISLPISGVDQESLAAGWERQGTAWKAIFRDRILYNPVVWRLAGGGYVLNRQIPLRPGEAQGAGRTVRELISQFGVDLVVLHFMGGGDADEIVSVCREERLPFAVQNHFSNDRFLHISIRKHATLASGVSGVNGCQVPDYLAGRFVNLGDGIDTCFWNPDRADVDAGGSSTPVIFLPARIVRTKGQADLVEVGTILLHRGFDFRIVFAGREDSASFSAELRELVSERGLGDRVTFLGNLSRAELRDWYARTAILAFPTYHHEGLGRIIIEAQAMRVPVVAYATGGVPDGVIAGRTGFLIETGNLKDLVNKISRLLSEPQLRCKMGQAGRELVLRRFSLSAVAERHERFYLNLLSRGNPAANPVETR